MLKRNYLFFDEDESAGTGEGKKLEAPESKPEEQKSDDVDPKKEYTEDELLNMDEDKIEKLKPDYSEPEEEQKGQEEKPETKPEPKKEEPESAKSILTKVNQRIAELDRREAELEKKMRASEFKDFQELDEDEEEVLKEQDPDAYNVYEEEKAKYQDFKKEMAERDTKTWNQEQSQEIAVFLADRFQLDLQNDADGSLKKIQEELNKDDSEMKTVFKEVLDHCQENYKPVKTVGDNPVFSSKQFIRAYRDLHFDEVVDSKLSAERTKILDSINAAGQNSSVFDQNRGSEHTSPLSKKPEDYTQEEILAMDDKTFQAFKKQQGIVIPT